MHARTQASNRLAAANTASHGPRERAKVRVKRTRDNLKDSSKERKVPKARTRAKHRKQVYQVLKTRNQRQARKLRNLHRQTCPTDTSCNDGWNCDDWNDGWSLDKWNDDWSSVGWHEGWEQTYDTSASSPKRFEWVKMNLDTGAAGEHIPIELWSRGSRRWKILSDCQW